MPHSAPPRRSIVLTGASQGLGKAVCETLRSEIFAGDQRILIGRSATEGPGSAETFLQRDLSQDRFDADGILIAPDVARLIFVNNAGTVEPIASFARIDPIELHKAMNVNFASPLAIAQHLARVARARSIPLLVLNVTSGAALRPVAGWTAYCTSKAAIRSALDVLALEEESVSVLHFDPGVIDTPMQARIRQSAPEDMPEVDAFRAMARENQLQTAAAVAGKLSGIIRDFAA